MKLQFDGLGIDLISDGQARVDAGGPFGLVPRNLYGRYLEPDDENTVPMVLTCMLVYSDGKTILFDTGLGDRPEVTKRWNLSRPQGGLVAELATRGLAPTDIDIVINTHLHSDHCGGNTRWEEGQIQATFSNAEYWVQRIEWAQAVHPDARTRSTYLQDNFSALMTEGRLRLLHGDTQVTDHIRCVVTEGHTRAHQSILLQSGDWRGLYVADMASYAIHMERTAWFTAYDVLPLENVSSKERWQKWAVQTGAWLFFEHDPKTPVARMIDHDGRPKLQTVEEAGLLIDSLPMQPQLLE